MVQLWVIIGLAISAAAVSTLGATFSILGMGKLFSGAVLAVWLMSGALEIAKFTVAAYLHQTWRDIGFIFRTYLVTSVMILSVITSMGIFGFLSDAYNASSATLELETIKLQKLQNEQGQSNNEIARINRTVDEIPNERITKKLKARAEAEPIIRDLNNKISRIETQITDAKLKIVEVKQKVGPLIYVSKAFNMDIDTVVKYLILILVSVFDPLAICLVVAFSDAIIKRATYKKTKEQKLNSTVEDVPEMNIAPKEKEEELLSESESDEAPTLKMSYSEEEEHLTDKQALPAEDKEEVG